MSSPSSPAISCGVLAGNDGHPQFEKTSIQSIRITSYNVCYTKLLRARTVKIFMVLVYDFRNRPWEMNVFQNIVPGLGMAFDDFMLLVGQNGRITSYNVCYTKLLRIVQVLGTKGCGQIKVFVILGHAHKIAKAVITSYSIHYTKLYESKVYQA